jgi:RNA polymerase sigma-70 factor (ECF subfamily)
MNKTLQQIWADFHKELEGYIFSRVKDRDITKDILQEIFFKIHQNISGLQDKSKLTSWIYQITRNAIIDHFRKVKTQVDFTGIDLIEPDFEQNENSDFQKCIKPFIYQLTDKYRDAILLTEFKGLSQIQLAEHLGISYSGAKSRVQRAKEKLKEIFSDCCHIQTDRYGNIVQYQSKKKCNTCCN